MALFEGVLGGVAPATTPQIPLVGFGGIWWGAKLSYFQGKTAPPDFDKRTFWSIFRHCAHLLVHFRSLRALSGPFAKTALESVAAEMRIRSSVAQTLVLPDSKAEPPPSASARRRRKEDRDRRGRRRREKAGHSIRGRLRTRRKESSLS